MAHPKTGYPGRLASYDGLFLQLDDGAVCDCGLVAWLKDLAFAYANATCGAEQREPGENHPDTDRFEAEESALRAAIAKARGGA